MNKKIPDGRARRPAKLLLAGLVSAAVLGGCSATTHSDVPVAAVTSHAAEIEAMLSRLVPRNEVQKIAKDGLAALSHGDYVAAGKLFQAGLRLEPGNGHLHFMNALAYHLQGLSGDSKMLDLAQAGYVTALSLDESNPLAAYLLGQIHFRKREYAVAQNYFAYGLLYAADDVALLNALAAASYYSHDAATAGWASQKAYALAPDKRTSIRNVLFADAAAGRFGETPRLLEAYEAASRGKATGDDAYWVDVKLEQTASRIAEWKKFHLAANDPIFSTPSSDIVTYSGDSDGEASGGPAAAPREMVTREEPTTAVAASADTAAGPAKNRPKMTHIDVVIIRTDEVRSQAKGINLLEGLQTTLGGTLFGYDYDKTTGTTRSKTIQTTINPVFTLKGLEYNLNIFNDERNKAEILARPSLLATEGVTSQFFSGGVLHVQLSSNIYDGGLEDINIGITLSVTPEFLDAETVGVSVQADYEFLEMQSENVGFTAFAQTTKTSVQAKAVLAFGETLILSGLSERENEDSQSGVPLLQDIPGIQYLFSKREKLEAKKSILILLTPRKPRYARESLTDAEFDNRADLEKVFTDKLKTVEKISNTNLNAAIAHLRDESLFYRQFRTGDVELRFFEDDDSIFGAIKRTLGFLYF